MPPSRIFRLYPENRAIYLDIRMPRYLCLPTVDLLSVLADPTRVRLLALLDQSPVRDRKDGSSSFYALASMGGWSTGAATTSSARLPRWEE